MTEPAVSELLTPPNGFPQPAKRSGRGWLVYALGIATGAVVVGAAWLIVALPGDAKPEAKPQSFELKGSMVLSDDNLGGTSSNCYGTRGYSDISAGTAVTVYGATGNVVATGSLGKGVRAAGTCTFSVSALNVPGDEKFYQVEVSHRGKITVDAAQARKIGLSATLGN